MRTSRIATSGPAPIFFRGSMISTGCAHYKVISAERAIHPLRVGETWKAPVDGWFVPDARWLEIRQAIAAKIEEIESHDRTNTDRD